LHPVFHAAHGAAHPGGGFVRLALHGVDHLRDFGGGAGGALGQLAHLVGHHGKATPHFAGTGGFDGGVQRQQVGLVGHVANDVDHRMDGIGLLVQCAHMVGHVAHRVGHAEDGAAAVFDYLLAVARLVAGVLRQRVGFLGTVGHVVDADGNLLQRGRHRRCRLALRFRTRGYLAGCGGEVGRRMGDFGGRGGHPLQAVVQARCQLVEVLQQTTDFILVADTAAARQVQMLGHVGNVGGGRVNAADHLAVGDYRHQYQHQQCQHGGHRQPQPGAVFGGFQVLVRYLA